METTKKVSHTPGPWKVEHVRSMYSSYDSNGEPSGAVCGSVGRINYGAGGGIDVWGHYMDIAETLATTNLIAAAPELLESLQWLIKQIPELKGEISLIGMQKCYDAIQKATE